MLRGKMPQKEAKRLKMLVFGESGVGKTTLATHFPKPYIIDTERGSVNDQYVEAIAMRDGVVFHTTSFDEIVQEVRLLISTAHDFRTLVIDPITVVYEDMLNHHARKVGEDYGRHYAAAKKEWRRLTALLSQLDMNVILTAHQKMQYADDGSFRVTGATYDGAKGTDYWVDLSLECYQSAGRYAKIVKSRIRDMEVGDDIMLDFEAIAESYGGNLDTQAKAKEFATAAEVEELTKMLDERPDGEDLRTKWLRAAGVEELEDMDENKVRRCLEWMQS